MILGDLLKAIGQIDDPRFRRVLLIGIALAFALLIAAYAALLWVLQMLFGDGAVLPLVGEVTWVGDLLSWASLGVMILLSVFLMVPVASAITSLFLDDVAQAVEDRHYPGLPPARTVGFYEGLRDSVNFLGLLVAANAFALVLYVIFAPLAPLIFLGLNGFLLGREYFQIAAMRREGRAGAVEMRRRNLGTVWLAGTLMAVPLTVPLVNLAVPIIGAAMFTHLYHRLRAAPSG